MMACVWIVLLWLRGVCGRVVAVVCLCLGLILCCLVGFFDCVYDVWDYFLVRFLIV